MLKNLVAASLLFATVFAGSAAHAEKTFRSAQSAAIAAGSKQLRISPKQLIAIRYFDGGKPSGDAQHMQFLVNKGNIANAPSVAVNVTKLKAGVFIATEE